MLSTSVEASWTKPVFSVLSIDHRDVNVTLPSNARYNQSLYIHVTICPRGKSPFKSPGNSQSIFAIVPQTTHMVPESSAFNLIEGSSNETNKVILCVINKNLALKYFSG